MSVTNLNRPNMTAAGASVTKLPSTKNSLSSNNLPLSNAISANTAQQQQQQQNRKPSSSNVGNMHRISPADKNNSNNIAGVDDTSTLSQLDFVNGERSNRKPLKPDMQKKLNNNNNNATFKRRSSSPSSALCAADPNTPDFVVPPSLSEMLQDFIVQVVSEAVPNDQLVEYAADYFKNLVLMKRAKQ